MSLAEELLADLEDDEGEELETIEEEADDASEPMEVETKDENGSFYYRLLLKAFYNVIFVAGSSAYGLEDVAKLYKSDRLKDVMEKMEYFSKNKRKQEDLQGPVEADPEYLLIVDANNVAAEIDDEIANIHRFAKDIYCKRFPDLETLVVQPLDYLLTAKELGNNIVNTKSNKVLAQCLSQATIMVVSVTASTTQGVDVSESDLEVINKAFDTGWYSNHV